MDITFDPTWPDAQRLAVIEQIAERMQSPPLLSLPDFVAIAEVIRFLASSPAQFLEKNIVAIHGALAH